MNWIMCNLPFSGIDWVDIPKPKIMVDAILDMAASYGLTAEILEDYTSVEEAAEDELCDEATNLQFFWELEKIEDPWERENWNRKQEAIKNDTFVGRGLNKPGVQIEMSDGKRYLIGDVLSSGMDKVQHEWYATRPFMSTDIVVRYRILDLA